MCITVARQQEQVPAARAHRPASVSTHVGGHVVTTCRDSAALETAVVPVGAPAAVRREIARRWQAGVAGRIIPQQWIVSGEALAGYGVHHGDVAQVWTTRPKLGALAIGEWPDGRTMLGQLTHRDGRLLLVDDQGQQLCQCGDDSFVLLGTVVDYERPPQHEACTPGLN